MIGRPPRRNQIAIHILHLFDMRHWIATVSFPWNALPVFQSGLLNNYKIKHTGMIAVMAQSGIMRLSAVQQAVYPEGKTCAHQPVTVAQAPMSSCSSSERL